MCDLIKDMEQKLLGHWKVLLVAPPTDELLCSCFTEGAVKLAERWGKRCKRAVDCVLVECCMYGYRWLTPTQLKSVVTDVLGLRVPVSGAELVVLEQETDKVRTVHADCLRKVAEREKRPLASSASADAERQPLILILDKQLQALPWESTAILAEHPVSRMPSLPFVTRLAQRLAAQCGDQARQQPQKDIVRDGVDTRRAFYVLDPANNLQKTRAKFEPIFRDRYGWDGIAGEKPTPEQFKNALECHDLVVYCGHGTGEQYLAGSAVQQLRRCGVALLMGCSSGSLAAQGDFEPTGMPLHYIIAGCPGVVGNLWDVTDGDADLLTEDLLEKWTGGSDPQRAVPLLARALAAARHACKLRYLIGAAAVCYGVPVHVRQKRRV
eukprot:TRINITY_DN1517_c1_g2_i2.p1 TRINITY_DN1517_c1_g2~~TRINITY_DN1517_c1_g2_i2.p1  ORF type:complete len:381 (+),score=101.23 TRINITY_DN1517_c1_g2_i2:664-1806(+)